jgi:uncharacterized membrane protein YkvA (DUF1232 family)
MVAAMPPTGPRRIALLVVTQLCLLGVTTGAEAASPDFTPQMSALAVRAGASGVAWSLTNSQSLLRDGVHLGAEQPFDQPLRGWTRGFLRNARRTLRQSFWFLSYAARTWAKWLFRASFFALFAVLVALCDRNLIKAWRLEGLKVLGTYVPLMLYVYARLLIDRRVHWGWKLLLLGAIFYGARWLDMWPDRRFVPGFVDDAIVIAVATRLFVFQCPDEVVDEHAARALASRSRGASLKQARQR